MIPKGQYTDLDDFVQNAKEKEIYEFFKAISHVAKMLKVSNVDGGYRTLSNIANNGGQEIPHLHFHIFGGEKLARWFLEMRKVKRYFLEILPRLHQTQKLDFKNNNHVYCEFNKNVALNRFFMKKLAKIIFGRID